MLPLMKARKCDYPGCNVSAPEELCRLATGHDLCLTHVDPSELCSDKTIGPWVRDLFKRLLVHAKLPPDYGS